MTAGMHEFLYKIPGITDGYRPGAHRSRSRGAGMAFAGHARLFDYPDPRRIDLHASLSSLHGEWLVRTSQQRSAVVIKVVVDVSASMHFGASTSKLEVVADFLLALGYSAHRAGDSVGLMAFDHEFREDLYMPARSGRGIGNAMAATVRASTAGNAPGSLQGLSECIDRIAGSGGLVFLVSDFHYSLDGLATVLDKLGDLLVVPLVVWDKAEIEPPAEGGLLSVRDAESGRIRRLWLRDELQRQWRDKVARRRDELGALFAASDMRSFYIEGGFDAEALSKYFLEHVV
ncbi:MAG: MxaS protein [Gammaproteobacteria bacterium]|nr:MxaS protein [Gammaproteobacteria bacterium]